MLIAYDVIKKDLADIKNNIENIIKTKIQEKTFNIDELKLSKDSKYYKHIEFDKLTWVFYW